MQMQMSIRRALLVALAIAVVQVSTSGPASARWGFGGKAVKPAAVTSRPGQKARRPLLRRIFNKRNLKLATATVIAGAVALSAVSASAAPVQIRDGREHIAYAEMVRGPNGRPLVVSTVEGVNLGRMDQSGARIRSPVERIGTRERAQIVIGAEKLQRAGFQVHYLGEGNPVIERHLPRQVDPGGLSVTINGRTLEGREVLRYGGLMQGAALKHHGEVLGTVSGRGPDGLNFFSSAGQPAVVSHGGQINLNR